MQTSGKTVVKVGVLIEHQNKLLLIKERCRRDQKYYWNIIKGTLEPDRVLVLTLLYHQEYHRGQVRLMRFLWRETSKHGQ